ncbi:NAD(P)H-dependent oxidoreductase [Pseudooceanicola sp. HF7]|uniref:NAD(P)H-dependent oxidoreductase n=1 Tax=Pseudooceanicola sp. HF7 TaxID=2721560 RepID=UPI00143030AD|nr:NAD(P)H-dependent oxidoreductase [Pseudooceanicola sp. HF7]NIZ10272.1 NAD(P)H-dependent oxidoreductase [Pseudooceanicola sp. HF7]
MFLDKLNWRYATKKMDPARPAPEDKVEKIVEAVRMAPTSSGTQPFELLVVTNPEIREKLQVAALGQTQLTEGSHVLVFAAWDNYTEDRLDGVLEATEAERGESEGMTNYYTRLKNAYLPREERDNFEHAARQAYIGLGFALAAAAELEVDSTPMEGFDADEVDQILGLREKGLRSVVILPLGTRDAGNDWLVDMKKVRRAPDEIITRID